MFPRNSICRGPLATPPVPNELDCTAVLLQPNVGWLKTFSISAWKEKRTLSVIGMYLEIEVSLNV